MKFIMEKSANFNSNTKFPNEMLFLVVLVCILPLILNLFSVDFGTRKHVIDLHNASDVSPVQLVDAMHNSLRGSFTHTLLEWSAFSTAIFTVFLAFTHFNITHDVTTPVIGVALFCSGSMDAFHTLAATRIIEAVADNRNLIPFTWAICRLFNALILIVGVSIFLIKDYRNLEGNLGFILFISLVFGIIAYSIIHFCATSSHLPQTMFPDSLITRPYDVAPLVLFFVAGIVLYPFYKKHPSYFSHALIIGLIPQISTQFHMAFGSTALFDNHFNIAHFLKIIAYLVPFGGLCLDYIQTYRDKATTANKLNEQLHLAKFGKDITLALTMNGSLQKILQRCSEYIVQYLNVSFARIWTFNEQDKMLELQASAGLYTHINGGHACVPLGKLKIGKIAMTQKPYLSNSVLDDIPGINRDWARKEEMVAFAGYPLVVENHVVGVMAMFSKKPLYDAVLKSLSSVADGIALGIEHKMAEETLKESEKRTNLILESAYDGFIAINASGCISDWNEQAESIFGWSRSEMIGHSLASTVIPPQHRQQHLKSLKCFLETGESTILNKRIEITAMHSDGHEFPVELVVWPIRMEKNISFNAFVRDITAKKLSEQAQIASKQKLQKAYDDLKELDRLKNDFLSTMNHELRTPLTVILGNTKTIVEDIDKMPPDIMKDFLGDVLEQGNHLLSLINDILDVAKMESGRFSINFEKTDINSVVIDSISGLKILADKKDLSLKKDIDESEPIYLNADPLRLKQVIINLVNNSIKFTNTGGTITVKAEKNDNKAWISVRDTGVGISREKIKHLFDRFYQIDNSSTRQYGGTGLGLSIAKQIVERHKGEIIVESEIGIGSLFSFSIPLFDI